MGNGDKRYAEQKAISALVFPDAKTGVFAK
jgi:hypothetical protein